jgi:hypothetical protein
MAIDGTLQSTAEQARFLDRLDRVRASHPGNPCARHMTRALFNSFSAAQRGRLYACCRSGAENPDSSIGCYINRPSDLQEFTAFFGALIREHHRLESAGCLTTGSDRPRPDLSDPDLSNLGLPPLSIRVRAGRNLQGFPLPAAMDRAARIALERAMVRALQVLINDPLYGGRIYSLTPSFGAKGLNPNFITPGQYRDLVSVHIMFADMQADPYMASGGLAADWPHGRACYVSADRSIIVWIGEEDHLRIISVQTTSSLRHPWDRLQAVLARIEALPGIGFVHDPAYGYVTSCPSNLGSGLRLSARLNVPALTAPGVDTQTVCRNAGLTARGLAGDHAPIIGCGPLDLSPICRVFAEDRDVLGALYQGLAKLLGDGASSGRRAAT